MSESEGLRTCETEPIAETETLSQWVCVNKNKRKQREVERVDEAFLVRT